MFNTDNYKQALEAHKSSLIRLNKESEKAEDYIFAMLIKNYGKTFKLQEGNYSLQLAEIGLSVFGNFLTLYLVRNNLEGIQTTEEQRTAYKNYRSGKINPSQLLSLTENTDDANQDADDCDPSHQDTTPIVFKLQNRIDENVIFQWLDKDSLQVSFTNNEFSVD